MSAGLDAGKVEHMVPKSKRLRLRRDEVFMLKGSTMFPRLKEVMAEMPEDAVVSYVNLVEWPAVAWDNWDGLATMAGDAAHCMSIWRLIHAAAVECTRAQQAAEYLLPRQLEEIPDRAAVPAAEPHLNV
ncbi:hypothetical protein B0T17DRAFT_507503 [Bombardia bombarda]|uniref:Uncharacterized protein n=1 Tax=Bombardia bombarda TaxID=252184 RepID=A0AA39XBW7_9PEZI|nr:hypothetical protein B0T17DRAFT_507503 [Bombardia bombarda]